MLLRANYPSRISDRLLSVCKRHRGLPAANSRAMVLPAAECFPINVPCQNTGKHAESVLLIHMFYADRHCCPTLSSRACLSAYYSGILLCSKPTSYRQTCSDLPVTVIYQTHQPSGNQNHPHYQCHQMCCQTL